MRSALNVLDAARVRGRPWELTDAVGLEYQRLRDPRARMPLRQLVALYETAATYTRESTFGLRVGASADPRAYDLMGYIVVNSATLGDALHHAARYLPLWTDGATITVIPDGRVVHVLWEYLDPAIVECRQDCEMSVMALASIGRRFAGGIAPREVHFRHPAPRHRRAHQMRFSAPTNGLIFDAAALRAPLPNADARLKELLVGYADAGLPTHGNLADRVKWHSMHARLEIVAQRMGMSTRSLERRLEERGTSFRELRGRARRETAMRCLKETNLTVAQIAERVGYANPTELHRAFRAWTGTTPGAYRKRREPADPLDDLVV